MEKEPQAELCEVLWAPPPPPMVRSLGDPYLCSVSIYIRHINVNVYVHAINAYRGIRGRSPLILNLGSEWGVSSQLHSPTALTPRSDPDRHSIGGWVSPRANLVNFERRKASCPCRGLNPISSNPWPSHITNRLYRLPLQSVSFGTGWS
jgi:hypothetical protein